MTPKDIQKVKTTRKKIEDMLKKSNVESLKKEFLSELSKEEDPRLKQRPYDWFANIKQEKGVVKK